MSRRSIIATAVGWTRDAGRARWKATARNSSRYSRTREYDGVSRGSAGSNPSASSTRRPIDAASRTRTCGVTRASAALADVGDLVGRALVDEPRQQRRPVGARVGAHDAAGDGAGERRDGDGHLTEHEQRHRCAGSGGAAETASRARFRSRSSATFARNGSTAYSLMIDAGSCIAPCIGSGLSALYRVRFLPCDSRSPALRCARSSSPPAVAPSDERLDVHRRLRRAARRPRDRHRTVALVAPRPARTPTRSTRPTCSSRAAPTTRRARRCACRSACCTRTGRSSRPTAARSTSTSPPTASPPSVGPFEATYVPIEGPGHQARARGHQGRLRRPHDAARRRAGTSWRPSTRSTARSRRPAAASTSPTPRRRRPSAPTRCRPTRRRSSPPTATSRRSRPPIRRTRRCSQYSIADSLKAKKPFVAVFATPKFCSSRLCGPTVKIVEAVQKDMKDTPMRFIHVEIYRDNDPDSGPNPWVQQWALPSEPWVFVVGADGKIKSKFEGAVGLRRARAGGARGPSARAEQRDRRREAVQVVAAADRPDLALAEHARGGHAEQRRRPARRRGRRPRTGCGRGRCTRTAARRGRRPAPPRSTCSSSAVADASSRTCSRNVWPTRGTSPIMIAPRSRSAPSSTRTR